MIQLIMCVLEQLLPSATRCSREPQAGLCCRAQLPTVNNIRQRHGPKSLNQRAYWKLQMQLQLECVWLPFLCDVTCSKPKFYAAQLVIWGGGHVFTIAPFTWMYNLSIKLCPGTWLLQPVLNALLSEWLGGCNLSGGQESCQCWCVVIPHHRNPRLHQSGAIDW